jgi:nucleoside-diphosphate-sugar epimerase
MKICISGNKGFVGKHLIEYLSKNPTIEVVCLAEVNDYLSDFEKLNTNIGNFDVFIHLASTSFVPDSYTKPHFFYKNNFNTTINGLELCRLRNAKFINISSYVYGHPQYLPINEDHPLVAANIYAHTKMINEQVCQQYSTIFDMPVAILRPFNIYGPGQKQNFLIPSIIAQAQSGHIQLNDPTPKRDFLYIDDFVKAIYAACITDTNHQPINLASGTSSSIQDIINIVQKAFPNTTVAFSNIQRPNEIMDTIGDIKLAAKILNWKPQIDLQNGINKIIDTLNDRN